MTERVGLPTASFARDVLSAMHGSAVTPAAFYSERFSFASSASREYFFHRPPASRETRKR